MAQISSPARRLLFTLPRRHSSAASTRAADDGVCLLSPESVVIAKMSSRLRRRGPMLSRTRQPLLIYLGVNSAVPLFTLQRLAWMDITDQMVFNARRFDIEVIVRDMPQNAPHSGLSSSPIALQLRAPLRLKLRDETVGRLPKFTRIMFPLTLCFLVDDPRAPNCDLTRSSSMLVESEHDQGTIGPSLKRFSTWRLAPFFPSSAASSSTLSSVSILTTPSTAFSRKTWIVQGCPRDVKESNWTLSDSVTPGPRTLSSE